MARIRQKFISIVPLFIYLFIYHVYLHLIIFVLIWGWKLFYLLHLCICRIPLMYVCTHNLCCWGDHRWFM